MPIYNIASILNPQFSSQSKCITSLTKTPLPIYSSIYRSIYIHNLPNYVHLNLATHILRLDTQVDYFAIYPVRLRSFFNIYILGDFVNFVATTYTAFLCALLGVHLIHASTTSSVIFQLCLSLYTCIICTMACVAVMFFCMPPRFGYVQIPGAWGVYDVLGIWMWNECDFAVAEWLVLKSC